MSPSPYSQSGGTSTPTGGSAPRHASTSSRGRAISGPPFVTTQRSSVMCSRADPRDEGLARFTGGGVRRRVEDDRRAAVRSIEAHRAFEMTGDDELAAASAESGGDAAIDSERPRALIVGVTKVPVP